MVICIIIITNDFDRYHLKFWSFPVLHTLERISKCREVVIHEYLATLKQVLPVPREVPLQVTIATI